MTNKEINILSKACIILDKLQVELYKESPYPIPTAKECRDRILKAMHYLEQLDK